MKNFDINLIINLQRGLRSPFLDYLFYIISFIGAEYFFLGATAILLWCVNKRFGYKFFNIFVVGQLFTGIIKSLVGRSRPFTERIVDSNGNHAGPESVISETSGNSFPSGHSQNVANMATQFSLVAKNQNKKIFKRTVAAGAFITLLVMFSRMYLGQHYLTDVICGAFLGVFVAVVFTDLFRLLKDKEERLFLVILPLTVVLAAIFLGIGKNADGAMKLFGVWGAVSLGYFLEKKYVRYEVKSGVFFKQIIKVFIGLVVIVVILEGLDVISSKITGRPEMLLEYIRYFLTGIAASFGMPLFFKAVKL